MNAYVILDRESRQFWTGAGWTPDESLAQRFAWMSLASIDGQRFCDGRSWEIRLVTA